MSNSRTLSSPKLASSGGKISHDPGFTQVPVRILQAGGTQRSCETQSVVLPGARALILPTLGPCHQRLPGVPTPRKSSVVPLAANPPAAAGPEQPSRTDQV